MPPDSTIADRLLEGDRTVALELAECLLKPHRDNLVERPWGGDRLCALKRPRIAGRRAGRSASRSRSRPTTATTRRGCIRACSRSPTARRSRCPRCWPCTPTRCSAKNSCSCTAGGFRCCRSSSTSSSSCPCKRIRRATRRSTSSWMPSPVRRSASVSPSDVDADTWTAKLAGGRQDQKRLLELLGEDSADELQAAAQSHGSRAARRGRPSSKRRCARGSRPRTRGARSRRGSRRCARRIGPCSTR